ncbi:hypothetical protein OAA66_03480 [Planktomarina temperata]|nr:hypothetical protein [Planktomarina temperata]
MLKKTLLGCALSLAPLITNAQTTLTAETTTPGSTPHYIDSTLAAVLASAGVATMQITEGDPYQLGSSSRRGAFGYGPCAADLAFPDVAGDRPL